MNAIAIAVLFTLIFWGMFYYSFNKDRSRYRNCHLLCLALLSMIPLVTTVSGDQAKEVILVTAWLTVFAIMIVPFFLIHNGIVMIRNEGRCAAHLLSLALGIAILVGEILTAYNVVLYAKVFGLEAQDEGNIRYYEKLGFRVIGSSRYEKGNITHTYMLYDNSHGKGEGI